MKPVLLRTLLPVVLITSAAVAQAHPGHEGDELTWDFGHLAHHPDATLCVVAVLGVLVWAGTRLASLVAGDRDQSLRGSHAKRGK